MLEYQVKVAFDQVNYVDISDRVKGIGNNVGRSYELDDFEAGTLSLTLDNSDGRFTPGRVRTERAVNLVRNPSLQGGTTTGWGVARMSSAASTDWSVNSGGYSIKGTVNVTDNPAYFYAQPVTGPGANTRFPAVTGDFIHAEYTVKTTADVRLRLQVICYNDALAGVAGGFIGDTVDVTAGTVIRLTAQGTIGANVGGTGILPVLYVTAPGSNVLAAPMGTVTYADQAMIVKNGGTFTGYFDGNSEFAEWVGTPGLSESRLYHPNYYPNVKPRRPVKVVSVIDGADPEDVFTGHIERWPVNIGGGNASEVSVDAVDPYATLARKALKRPLAEKIRAFNPKRYYPCSDPAGATALADWGSDGVPATLAPNKAGGFITTGNPGLFPYGEGKSGGSVQIGGAGVSTWGGAIRVPLNVDTSAGFVTTFTFEFKSANDLDDIGSQTMLYSEYKVGQDASAPPLRGLWLDANGDGTYAFGMNHGIANLSDQQSHTFVPGKRYHVEFFTHRAGPSRFLGVNVYREGETTAMSSVSNDMSGLSPTAGDWGITTHAYYGGDPTSVRAVGLSQNISLSNITMDWDNAFPYASPALTAQEIAKVYGGAPITATAAATIIKDISGVSGITYLDSVSGINLSPPNWDDDTNSLDIWKAYAESIGGSIYFGPDGNLIVEARTYRMSPGAPVMTFKDANGFPTHEADLLFEQDEDRIANDITVIRTGDEAQFRAFDQASINEFERKTLERTTGTSNPLEAQDYANWLVYTRKDAITRCDNVTINVTAQGDTFAEALRSLKISDRIALDGLPSQAPYTRAEFFIEGIDRTVEVNGETPEITFRLQLSPADKFRVWVLEDPAFGLLDDTAILAY